MNTTEDIKQKREMLFTLKIRFSSHTQPIKEAAIDKIVEQDLFLCDQAKGVKLQEIKSQGGLSFPSGNKALQEKDIGDSIDRLVKNNRVSLISKNEGLYKLTKNAFLELERQASETERRLDAAIAKLFKNVPKQKLYKAPFLSCLAIIFSTLGDINIRIIKGNIKRDELLSYPLLISAIEQSLKEVDSIDSELFKNAILRFFQEDDPEYNAIKWNMAQNYYIAKVIGLEPDNIILSKELFGGADLYIDTNVIVSALETNHRYHKSFQELNKICKKLNINIKVCQISIDELRKVTSNARTLIEKVANQIPDETAPKIRGIFYEKYYEESKLNNEVNLDKIFSNFDSPTEDLKKIFNINLVDDAWFDKLKGDKDISEFAKYLADRYQKLTNRYKRITPATHDALLIKWINKESINNGNNKVGLVTLDKSLPGTLNNDGYSFIITLDALLQWISPIAVQFEDEENFASVFSDAIKYQLLPRDTFFEMNDFLMFDDAHMSCKELPAEDVEGCIRYIKLNAQTLNPSDPADREKISLEIKKYFVDPDRKYKKNLEQLEQEKKNNEETYKKKLYEISKQNDALKAEIVTMKQTENEQINNLRDKLETLSSTLQKKDKDAQEQKGKQAAKRRTITVIILCTFYEGVVVYMSYKYALGENLLQKILSTWGLSTLVVPLFIVLFIAFLGKERIRLLGWPFTKILK